MADPPSGSDELEFTAVCGQDVASGGSGVDKKCSRPDDDISPGAARQGGDLA